MTKRFEGGVVSELDLRQAESEAAVAAAAVPNLEQQIDQKENELSILLGRNPEDITHGRGVFESAIPEVPRHCAAATSVVPLSPKHTNGFERSGRFFDYNAEDPGTQAAQDRQVQALQRTLRLATLRYENGYWSFLEVLDAPAQSF